DHDELLHARMVDLALLQEFGNDADHRAAGGEAGIRSESHQPDPAAAIDHGDAAPGQATTEACGGLSVAGVDLPRRAAINANGFNLAHACLNDLGRRQDAVTWHKPPPCWEIIDPARWNRQVAHAVIIRPICSTRGE